MFLHMSPSCRERGEKLQSHLPLVSRGGKKGDEIKFALKLGCILSMGLFSSIVLTFSQVWVTQCVDVPGGT